MERSTMLLIGKPSISMGHLYHGYVSHNQMVTWSNFLAIFLATFLAVRYVRFGYPHGSAFWDIGILATGYPLGALLGKGWEKPWDGMGAPDFQSHTHMAMDQYLLIPFLGDEHPFTSYFVVSCINSLSYLVGGLEHQFFIFPYIGNNIIPTDEVIFFRGVETTNQIFYHISNERFENGEPRS